MEGLAVIEWSDEQLSAHLDGALAPAEAAALEAAMARDAGLAARFAALAQVDEALRQAFDGPLQEPIPDRFRALIEGPGDAGAPVGAAVVDLAARRANRPARSFDWRIPLAASIALAVGWMGGLSMRGEGDLQQAILRADATQLEPRNPLYRLLEETPSAQEVRLANGEAFKPVLSFAAADGRFCREFELAADASTAVGVACRAEEAWRVEILLAADDRPSGADGYVQASGYNEAALDAALDTLGAAEPLSPEAEAALIAQGWSGR